MCFPMEVEARARTRTQTPTNYTSDTKTMHDVTGTTNLRFDKTLLGWIIVIFFGVMISMAATVGTIQGQIPSNVPAAANVGGQQITQVIAAVNPQSAAGASTSPIPPPYVFMLVWPLLYALIALALWHSYRVTGLRAWYWLALVGLALNFVWMPVFLSNGGIQAAQAILTLLIIVTAFQFVFLMCHDPFAAALYVPYLVWLLYAYSLNSYLVDQITAEPTA